MRAAWGSALVVLVAALAGAGPAFGISSPRLGAPASGATVGALPVFSWGAVRGADHYEFQVAADKRFNSPVLGHGYDDFFTKNTRATLKKTVPNGRLFWHVRAVTAAGRVSAWSGTRSLDKAWTTTPALVAPVNGQTLTFPQNPLRLTWSPVSRAVKYIVTLATDPKLGSPVAGTPLQTQATSFTGSAGASLAPGLYYWGVTPLDAEGNRGKPSVVGSFRFSWPSQTTPDVSDLVSDPEVFDPLFSWNPVPGAARYEVEINSSSDFAPGSKVCCDGTTIATKLSPQKLFKDNTYYWRVRPFDADNNAGVWNRGPDFSKEFDKVPPVTGESIKNLRLRTDLYPDADPGTVGYETTTPVVSWDPVPGASSYQVDVTPFTGSPARCDATASVSHWRITTASTSWTPLGPTPPPIKPFDTQTAISNDGSTQPIVGQTYCVRVRARSDRDSKNADVYGDYAYVTNGDQASASFAPSFTFTGYAAGGACSPNCADGYLGSGDYIGPTGGVRVTSTPLYRWKPIAGAGSYYVLVAKDPAFHTVVDYALTRIPAYAPRIRNMPLTYSDETTLYYWAILPASGSSGTGAVGDPLQAAYQNFQKWSDPPALLEPVPDAAVLDQPTFRWTLATGARRYRLQVAQDPSFGKLLDDVTTSSTSYTSDTTYPADTKLYWRVRADDENLIAQRWSDTGTFEKRLRTPIQSPLASALGTLVPTWTWSPVEGAVSYNIQADLPDGTHRSFSNVRSAAFTPTLIAGTGVFGIRVSANFPRDLFGTVPGPYSATQTFTRTLPEPHGATADVSRTSLAFRWQPVLGVKHYRIQVSTTQDFGHVVESTTTDNTSYAPQMTTSAYQDGGSFWWRVGSVDELGNVGDYTDEQRIALPQRIRLFATGLLYRGKRGTINVTVTNPKSQPIGRVSVSVSGAGVSPSTKRTDASGKTSFRVRPTRAGQVKVHATKSGYKSATVYLTVRSK